MALTDTGSGSAASAASGSSPALTLANVEGAIATASHRSTSDATQLAEIDQAITAVGLAVCTWEGIKWWWLHDTGSFSTVADTDSYALRTVNSSDMSDLYAIERVYYDDDWTLNSLTWQEYQQWYRISQPTASTTKPYGYAIKGEPPYLHIMPTPDAAYTMYVDYIKRHSKITSAASSDGDLLIPGEYHWQLYVNGATWLLKHEYDGPGSLRECAAFIDGIARMKAANASHYDPTHSLDMFRDARQGSLPHDRRIIETSDGFLVQNDVSV